MGLRHIRIPTRVVEVSSDEDQSITLRGVSFSDLMMLMAAHAGDMTLVFARVLQLAEKDRMMGIQAAISQISKDAPQLVGAVIALAADDYEPETIQIACDLPFSKQIMCIEAIFELTFTSEGDVKKLMESVVKMIQAASATLTELQTSPLGIGGSEGK